MDVTLLEPLGRSEEFRAPANSPLRGAFEDAFNQWLFELGHPTGEMDDLLPTYPYQLPAYQKILAMGEQALPFLIEKMAEGIFFFNWAVEVITGVTVPLEVRRTGEQSATRWLLDKWKAERLVPVAR